MRYILIITLVAVGILSAATMDFLNLKTDSDVVKIGALLCLTGSCAEWGQASLKGLKLAAEQINFQGGINNKKIELYVEDSQEAKGPSFTISGYRRLRAESVYLIIGPTWSPAGLAIAPIAAKDSVIMISASLGVREFNEYADNLFNLWPHDEIATKKLAQYAKESSYSRVAIFSSQQEWEETQGLVFKNEFERLGGQIIAYETPLQTVTDLRAEALRIIKTKPDAVLFSNFAQMAIASKELAKLGYTKPQLAVLMDETRIKASNGTLQDTVYVTYSPATEGFQEDFEEKFNELPKAYASTAYDALILISQVGNKSLSVKYQEILKALNQVESFSGASGELSFDKLGGIGKQAVLEKVL